VAITLPVVVMDFVQVQLNFHVTCVGDGFYSCMTGIAPLLILFKRKINFHFHIPPKPSFIFYKFGLGVFIPSQQVFSSISS
jgi:hypothetical protein